MLHDILVMVKVYADDYVLYSEIDNISDQELLNDAFQQIVDWCDAWQMSINFEKTVFLSISHKKHKLTFPYGITNIYLSKVTHNSYLGLWITNDLTWTKHLEYVVANALKLSAPTVRLLEYKALILSMLDYACVI